MNGERKERDEIKATRKGRRRRKKNKVASGSDLGARDKKGAGSRVSRGVAVS
jgi:hypothetical protein